MLFGELPVMRESDGPIHNAVSGDRWPLGLRSRLARNLGKADGPGFDLLGWQIKEGHGWPLGGLSLPIGGGLQEARGTGVQ
eukprot:6962341-Alexandrium_andersonii.AAC.1